MWELMKLLFGFVRFEIAGGEGGPGEEEVEENDEPDPEDEPVEGEETGEEVEEDSKTANMRALREKARLADEARIRAEGRAEAAERAAQQAGQRGRQQDDDDTAPKDENETQKFVRVGNKAIKTVTAETNRALAIAIDAGDKAEFYNSDDPLVKKYKKQIEAEVLRMAKEGNRAPREAILTFIVGAEARKAAATPKGKQQTRDQREAAEERVRAARGKPGAAPRSDRGGKEKGSERQQRRARLEGKPI